MHSYGLTCLSIAAIALTPSVVARDIPKNLSNFYSRVKSDESCPHELQGGFHGTGEGPKSFSYCQDTETGVLYIHGAGGQLVNMDIDCDGEQGGAGEDGRCGDSEDTQSQTSFKDTVASYGSGVKDLNAKVHPYVVFGNDQTDPSFDPQSYDIQPLSVMAVVCGNQLVYGVWGDTNGNDGPPVVGEASISLATACYGNSINGNSGHDENDVLYVAFPGADAVPGAAGAKWNAQSFDDFEESIQALGDKLVSRL